MLAVLSDFWSEELLLLDHNGWCRHAGGSEVLLHIIAHGNVEIAIVVVLGGLSFGHIILHHFVLSLLYAFALKLFYKVRCFLVGCRRFGDLTCDRLSTCQLRR